MTATDPIGSTFSADLVAGLGELQDVTVDETAEVESQRTGAKYSYRYATLGQVMKAVRPVLAAHHLAISQEVSTVDDTVQVVTRLLHASGEAYATPPATMHFKPDPQHLGSIVTYLRRYQLVALLGLAIEDDDGNLAAQAARQQTRAPARRRSSTSPAPLTREQSEKIAHRFAELGMAGDECRDDRRAFIAEVLGREIATTSDVKTAADGDRLLAALEARIADVTPETITT